MATPTPNDAVMDQSRTRAELIGRIGAYYRAAQDLRRGICLLNADQPDEAVKAFSRAVESGCDFRSLPSYVAACLLAQGNPGAAAAEFEKAADATPGSAAIGIRRALALWAAGRCEPALQCLRDGIQADPECAELHFQLGTLVALLERYDEAELRFTQAISLDRDHTEALVSLAMCCGVRNAPTEAVEYLRRAQARRRHDARIGLLLAQAAKVAHQRGQRFDLRAAMPAQEPWADRRGIAELSRVIEREPDFVDAFLSISVGEVDEEVFAMLLATLELALERQPEHAELRYHCGRVLGRLGRHEAAIEQNEQAVRIDPKSTRALIELGKLYSDTDRSADATARLEQAVAAGADYADVHFLLGNLYRAEGQLQRARSAYRRALSIDQRFEPAQKALEELPV